MPFWTYILHCRGGAFYTGHSDDLEYRVAQHKSGMVAGFTQDKLPVELVWSQEFGTRQEAFEAERRIKGWSRAKKLALIRGDWGAISNHAKKKSGPSTSSGRAVIEIASDAFETVLAAARSAHPREACGLLLGDGAAITHANPTANVHPTPATHFEIDPQALIDAHRAEREGGRKLMGYFHSHPTGDPHPSDTDQAMSAGDGRIWAIAAGEGLMFWKDDAQGFHALSYTVIGG